VCLSDKKNLLDWPLRAFISHCQHVFLFLVDLEEMADVTRLSFTTCGWQPAIVFLENGNRTAAAKPPARADHCCWSFALSGAIVNRRGESGLACAP